MMADLGATQGKKYSSAQFVQAELSSETGFIVVDTAHFKAGVQAILFLASSALTIGPGLDVRADETDCGGFLPEHGWQ